MALTGARIRAALPKAPVEAKPMSESDDTLQRLARTIKSRRGDAAGKSYTRQLLEAGPAKCAKKFGEEAVEAVIAAVAQDESALKAEAADVLYHLLVLLEARNVALEDVLAVLRQREGTSGLDEKAARSGTARGPA